MKERDCLSAGIRTRCITNARHEHYWCTNSLTHKSDLTDLIPSLPTWNFSQGKNISCNSSVNQTWLPKNGTFCGQRTTNQNALLKEKIKKRREDETDDVCSYCMTLRNNRILEIGRGNTRSHSAENSLWKRLKQKQMFCETLNLHKTNRLAFRTHCAMMWFMYYRCYTIHSTCMYQLTFMNGFAL